MSVKVTHEATEEIAQRPAGRALVKVGGNGDGQVPRSAGTRRKLLSGGIALLGAACVGGLTARIVSEAARAKEVAHLRALIAELTKEWPRRPIRMVVPFADDGPLAMLARQLVAPLSRELRQQVVPTIEPGNGGVRGTLLVRRSAADGHTILLHNTAFVLAPAVNKVADYACDDFEPLGLIDRGRMALIARTDIIPDPAELLRSMASTVHRIGHAGVGSNSHMCASFLKQALNAKLDFHPFDGTRPAIRALDAGSIDLLCDQLVHCLPWIKAGAVKPIAVLGEAGEATLPGVKPITHFGDVNRALLDFPRVHVWNGLYAPRGTPEPARIVLNFALRAALVSKEMSAWFAAQPTELFSDHSPIAHREHVKAELDRWSARAVSGNDIAPPRPELINRGFRLKQAMKPD